MPHLYKVLASIFDITSGIVSLLDLATDLVILITWYYDGKIVFFKISLCILILAQLSYLILFYYNHGKNSRDTACHSILSILCTLPFTPFLSFIFYWVSLDDSWLRNLIDSYLLCYNFEWYRFSPDLSANPKQQYLEEQVYKHVGFLLQATIEAFPQSLLQLTFIVYYNHPTPISVFSVLTSMTSVCSKLFIMVWAGIGLNGKKNRIFFWLCFVVDFFTIFFVTSFAFYVPNDASLQVYFTTFRRICIYQFMFGVLPFTIVASVGCYLHFTKRIMQSTSENICNKILFVLGLLFIVGISLFVVVLLLEIFCVLYCGYVVLYFNTISRLPDKNDAKEFYLRYIRWIINEPRDVLGLNNEIIIRRKQDRIIRLCVLNKVLLEQHKMHREPNVPHYMGRFGNYYDKELYEYLDKQRDTTQFRHVTLRSLRLNCARLSEKDLNWGHGPRHSEFLAAFYHHLYGYSLKQYRSSHKTIAVVTCTLLTYVFGPIYLLSKGINLCLPWMIVLYLYVGGGVNMFAVVDTFQLIMWCAYVLLLLLWSSLLFSIIKDDYYLWHILPSTQFFSAVHANKDIDEEINDCYFEMTMYPVVESLIHQQFGHDICCLIMDYYDAIHQTAEPINEVQTKHTQSI
eukprot:319142_1